MWHGTPVKYFLTRPGEEGFWSCVCWSNNSQFKTFLLKDDLLNKGRVKYVGTWSLGGVKGLQEKYVWQYRVARTRHRSYALGQCGDNALRCRSHHSPEPQRGVVVSSLSEEGHGHVLREQPHDAEQRYVLPEGLFVPRELLPISKRSQRWRTVRPCRDLTWERGTWSAPCHGWERSLTRRWLREAARRAWRRTASSWRWSGMISSGCPRQRDWPTCSSAGPRPTTSAA